MRIFGLDFSAASHEGVPIACTSCVLESRVLYIHCLALLENLDSFENFLSSEGPWVAGIDFPFGQPRKLVRNLGWPMRWEGYVGRSEGLGLTRFESVLEEYRETRPLGDKQYLRSVDSQANSRTPMSLRQVPTSRLFQRCAPRLLRSPVSVLPCRPNRDERVVLEAYPALVARRLIDRRPYKGTSTDELSDLRLDARRDLLDGLMSQRLEGEFGFPLRLTHLSVTSLSKSQAVTIWTPSYAVFRRPGPGTIAKRVGVFPRMPIVWKGGSSIPPWPPSSSRNRR